PVPADPCGVPSRSHRSNPHHRSARVIRWEVQAHWWQSKRRADGTYHRVEISGIPVAVSGRTAAFELAARWQAGPATIPGYPNNPSAQVIEVHVLERDGRHIVRTHRPTDRPLHADTSSDVHDQARSLADVRAANQDLLQGPR
ncbi:MAG: hypothetical protein KDC98_03790, partial [Planctomycetes bacterium]|nr:hypothetical protein [Planctomycetota bacterium]